MRRLMVLKNSCFELNKKLCASYAVETNLMPLAGLNMAHNHLIKAIELIGYYNQVLPRSMRGSMEEYLNDVPESAQRLIDVLNGCFVAIMSSFESCARKAIRWAPSVYGKVPDKIYLVNMIERSRKLGWVTTADEVVWKKFINLRNYLVHNNGEAQTTDCLVLPSGLIWEFRVGLQSKVTLRHIPESLHWLVAAYASWCERFLASWRASFNYSPVWNRPYSYNIVSSRVIPQWGVDDWSGTGHWVWQVQPPHKPGAF